VKVGIIIQARMGSTRLPGKVLRPIAGRPLLDHILERLQSLRQPVSVVIATSTLETDDAVETFCKERGVACYRGSEQDVLVRYLDCATHYGFDAVVRLTGDNPFTDMEELDRLIVLHLCEKNDYTHSFDALPIGVGAEIFSYAALERSDRDGHAPNHREHVNEYIEENPALFRIGRLRIPDSKTSPRLRLTVDTPDDHARACRLAEQAQGGSLSTEEAIRLCSRFA
jgi:spore coat polysaccharide biosynthesis protein SpsF